MTFYDIKEQDFVLDFDKDGLPVPFEKKKKVFRTKLAVVEEEPNQPTPTKQKSADKKKIITNKK